MQIIFRGQLPVNGQMLMRRLGYHVFRDPRSGEIGFLRRLGTGNYPRFHAHLEELPAGGLSIDLHLDMQQRSLSARRHGLKNDDAVAEERERIKQYVLQLPDSPADN